ncbi:hypothetical protein F5887DRAFT_854430, partial [Amanita rubescens]
LVFLWLAVPWLQAELDAFRDTFNNSKRRSDKHKIIPQGRAPDYIRKYPEQFDTRDYKVIVPEDLLQEMEDRWAPPDHSVFQLVPPEFAYHAVNLHRMCDCPPVSHGTFLLNFRQLRNAFMPDVDHHVLEGYVFSHDRDHDRDHDSVAIILGQRNYR